MQTSSDYSTPKARDPEHPNSTHGENTKPGNSPDPASKPGTPDVLGGFQQPSFNSDGGVSKMNGVSLGTTHDNHDVAHRIQGDPSHGPGGHPRGDTA